MLPISPASMSFIWFSTEHVNYVCWCCTRPMTVRRCNVCTYLKLTTTPIGEGFEGGNMKAHAGPFWELTMVKHCLHMYLFSFLVTRYYHCEASEGFRVFKNLVMFTNFYYFTRKSNSSSTSGHIILNFTTFHLAGHLLMWDDGSSIKPAKHGLANFTPHCETSQPPVFQLNLPNVPASNISPNKNNACH